jgi:hypothetical protein
MSQIAAAPPAPGDHGQFLVGQVFDAADDAHVRGSTLAD